SRASKSLYRQSCGSPATDDEAAAKPSETPGRWSQVPCCHSVAHLVGRRRAPGIDFRHVSAFARCSVRRNGAAGGAGHVARLRRTAATRQPSFRQQLDEGLASSTATVGLRPDADPLSWPAVRGLARDLPQQGQKRHHAFSCLCDRLRHSQRASLYRGLDARFLWRSHGRNPQTLAAASRTGGHSAAVFAAGSRFLQRPGHPLFAAGTLPFYHAGEVPRQTAARSATQPAVSLLEAERLEPAHADQYSQGACPRVDLCGLSQLSRQTKTPRTATVDLCLLGIETLVLALDVRNLPQPLWDRIELSSTESGAHPHHDTQSLVASVVRQLGADASQCLGVVALSSPRLASARQPCSQPGSPSFPNLAALAPACGRASSRPMRLRHPRPSPAATDYSEGGLRAYFGNY